MSEWKEYVLDKFTNVNPTESLSKNTMAKKIAMEMLQPFSKRVSGYTIEPYNGGMKFRNGDTVVARITPCLENGKTAFIDVLDENEVGFGSTEFIVIREKYNVSDKQFIYYFSVSSEFRDIAILSMTGSSGRQRVEIDVLRKHIFLFPPLPEQKAIAGVLSSLDDKIDLLHRQNKTLEAMAETLFRQWFVKPCVDGLLDGWKEQSLGELVSVVDNRGKTPPNIEDYTPYPVIEVNALGKDDRLVDYSVIKKYVDEETFNNWFRDRLNKYDILISTVGSIGALSMYIIEKGNIAQNVIGLHTEKISPFFLYQFLKFKVDEIIQYDIGGVQPSIKVPHILSITIPIPPQEKQNQFDKIIVTFMHKMGNNYIQIRTLEKLRNTLLPKLMSGEVMVTL
jgi:type I restriction enzyme S subunit